MTTLISTLQLNINETRSLMEQKVSELVSHGLSKINTKLNPEDGFIVKGTYDSGYSFGEDEGQITITINNKELYWKIPSRLEFGMKEGVLILKEFYTSSGNLQDDVTTHESLINATKMLNVVCELNEFLVESDFKNTKIIFSEMYELYNKKCNYKDQLTEASKASNNKKYQEQIKKLEEYFIVANASQIDQITSDLTNKKKIIENSRYLEMKLVAVTYNMDDSSMYVEELTALATLTSSDALKLRINGHVVPKNSLFGYLESVVLKNGKPLKNFSELPFKKEPRVNTIKLSDAIKNII